MIKAEDARNKMQLELQDIAHELSALKENIQENLQDLAGDTQDTAGPMNLTEDTVITSLGMGDKVNDTDALLEETTSTLVDSKTIVEKARLERERILHERNKRNKELAESVDREIEQLNRAQQEKAKKSKVDLSPAEIEQLQLSQQKPEYVTLSSSPPTSPVLTQVCGAFPHGIHWASLVEDPSTTAMWVLPNMNYPYALAIQDTGKSVFMKVKNSHFLQTGNLITDPSQTITVLRQSIYNNRVVMQTVVSNVDVPEVHTAYPALLPSGKHPVSLALLNRLKIMRNLVEGSIQFRPYCIPPADSSSLVQDETLGTTSTTPTTIDWMEGTAFAVDFLWNQKNYLSNLVNTIFLTGIAEHCVIEPTVECNFDVEAQTDTGEVIPFAPTPNNPRLFKGMIITAQTFNPLEHARLMGIIESVDSARDERLFSNHSKAGLFWILTVNINDVRIEMICLRKNVFMNHFNQPISEQKPRVGQRIYVKAWLQSYSALDPKNTCHRVYPKVIGLGETLKHKDLGILQEGISPDPKPCEVDEDNPQVSSSSSSASSSAAGIAASGHKKTSTQDPMRFLLHTKHINNRIAEATFDSRVLVRMNRTNFGYLFHFPPMTEPARIINAEAGPQENHSKIYQMIPQLLSMWRKGYETPPTLVAKSGNYDQLLPSPRLLTELGNVFSILRQGLRFAEIVNIGIVSKEMYRLVFEDNPFWQKQFLKFTSVAGHVQYSLNPIPSTQTLKNWVKSLALQNRLAIHKRQLDLDLVTANQLEYPMRKECVDDLTQHFRSLSLQCGLCNSRVPYSFHLANNHRKVVDIVHMSCEPCSRTKLWSQNSLALWFLPKEFLKNVFSWNLPGVRWYTTSDLLDAFRTMHIALIKKSIFRHDDDLVVFKKLITNLKENNFSASIVRPLESLLAEDAENKRQKGIFARQKFNELEVTLEVLSRYEDLPGIVKAFVKHRTALDQEDQHIIQTLSAGLRGDFMFEHYPFKAETSHLALFQAAPRNDTPLDFDTELSDLEHPAEWPMLNLKKPLSRHYIYYNTEHYASREFQELNKIAERQTASQLITLKQIFNNIEAAEPGLLNHVFSGSSARWLKETEADIEDEDEDEIMPRPRKKQKTHALIFSQKKSNASKKVNSAPFDMQTNTTDGLKKTDGSLLDKHMDMNDAFDPYPGSHESMDLDYTSPLLLSDSPMQVEDLPLSPTAAAPNMPLPFIDFNFDPRLAAILSPQASAASEDQQDIDNLEEPQKKLNK